MDRIEPTAATLDGIPIHLVDLADILCIIGGRIKARTRLTIGYVNAHVLNSATQDVELRHFLKKADLVYCDGIGPLWALRASGHQAPSRVPGRIAIPQLMAQAERNGWRVAWLGGEPGVVDLAISNMQTDYPDLKVVWTDHGFRPPSYESQQIQEINQTKPDVLLVGMGTPRQEVFLQKHRESLDVPVVWCVGATADYLSGTRPMGPKVLLRHQEWMARLVAEPQRMWRRYLIGNPRFVARMVKRRLWTPPQKRP